MLGPPARYRRQTSGLLGVKRVVLTPSHREHGRPMIDGLMVLSAPNGSTRATMGAAALSALRTAAVAGTSLALDGRPITFVGTDDLLREGRPEGLVVVQNLGSGLGDVMLADVVTRAVGT